MDNYESEEYFINSKSHEIIFRGVLSNRFVKELNEEEVEQLLFDEEVTVFIQAANDRLQPLEQSKIKERWEEHYKDHITTADEERYLDDFENGYYYYAQLWKMKLGKKMILLAYHH